MNEQLFNTSIEFGHDLFRLGASLKVTESTIKGIVKKENVNFLDILLLLGVGVNLAVNIVKTAESGEKLYNELFVPKQLPTPIPARTLVATRQRQEVYRYPAIKWN